MVKLSSILFWNGFHNMPKKYVKRAMFNGVVYENNHYITPPVVYNYTKDWVYDEHAPWTKAAQMTNDVVSMQYKKLKNIVVPPLKDWFFYRGDKVQIVRGKDAGKQGIVSGVIRQRNWVFVKGLNTKLYGLMPLEDSDVREYTQRERPLVVNRDVKLIDPSDFKPCDVELRFTEQGEQVRVSKRTGQVLPVPPESESTADYTKKSAYKPGASDTHPEHLKEVTFQPKYKTFEQDLREEYGIEQSGERAPTFVY